MASGKKMANNFTKKLVDNVSSTNKEFISETIKSMRGISQSIENSTLNFLINDMDNKANKIKERNIITNKKFKKV